MTEDQTVCVAALKDLVKVFCEERRWDPFHGPKDLAIGLVTEASELLEIFRFVDDERAHQLLVDPSQRKHMADELADSLYFILRFAERFEFDLTTALKEKLQKNALRYPPVVP